MKPGAIAKSAVDPGHFNNAISKGNSRSQELHTGSSHHDLGVVPDGISEDLETLIWW